MKTIIAAISHRKTEIEHVSEGATTVRGRGKEREKKKQFCISLSFSVIEGKMGKWNDEL